MKPPFCLCDYYDDLSVIGTYDTEEEARDEAERIIIHSDEECRIVLFEYDVIMQKYERVCEYTNEDE